MRRSSAPAPCCTCPVQQQLLVLDVGVRRGVARRARILIDHLIFTELSQGRQTCDVKVRVINAATEEKETLSTQSVWRGSC